MTNDQTRTFITFCVLGNMLESEGIRQSVLMTEDELTAVQALIQPLADSMTDAESQTFAIDVAKTLFREALDTLLAIETAEPAVISTE